MFETSAVIWVLYISMGFGGDLHKAAEFVEFESCVSFGKETTVMNYMEDQKKVYVHDDPPAPFVCAPIPQTQSEILRSFGKGGSPRDYE